MYLPCAVLESRAVYTHCYGHALNLAASESRAFDFKLISYIVYICFFFGWKLVRPKPDQPERLRRADYVAIVHRQMRDHSGKRKLFTCIHELAFVYLFPLKRKISTNQMKIYLWKWHHTRTINYELRLAVVPKPCVNVLSVGWNCLVWPLPFN